MAIDPESLGLGGAAVAAVTALGAYARARNGRNEKLDGILANLLANEQAAHASTRGELSQSRTGESLAIAQAATFGAQAEQLTERLDEMERRLDDADKRTESCERERDRDRARIAALEAHARARGYTPPGGTPIVESADRIKPLVKEEVFRGR